MKKAVLPILLCIFALASVHPAFGQDKIVVCGTGDSQDLLRRLAFAFEKSNPGTKVEVPDSIGSSGGIKATAKGECDIGRVARPIKDKEREYNLQYGLFAYSPVVMVADPDVYVSEITSQQVVDIVSGKTTMWSDIGGVEEEIRVVNREEKDSSRGVLNKHLEGFKGVASPVGVTVHSTPEAVDTLLKTENSFGYLPMAMAKNRALAVLKVNGNVPTPVNVRREKYNMVAPFGLVWKGELKGLAESFYQFVRSKEGAAIILEYGIVPAKLL